MRYSLVVIYKHVQCHFEGGGCHTILQSYRTTPEAMLCSVASNLLVKIAKRTYFLSLGMDL